MKDQLETGVLDTRFGKVTMVTCECGQALHFKEGGLPSQRCHVCDRIVQEGAVMKNQWHSVTDRLPAKGLWLVYGSSRTSPPTMRVDEYDGEWGWTGPLDVTHWRALPLPPDMPDQAADPIPFLPPGFLLLLDKTVVDELTSVTMSTKRDGRLTLVTISAELDTAASPYPFHEKAVGNDDVVLELHKPPNRITGTGQITEATARGFVWSGVAVD